MHIRYDTEDHNNETRAERNERVGFGHKTPDFEVPRAGFYLLEWFYDLRQCYRDLVDGVPVAIPPSEYKAWAELRGLVVRPVEYGILQAMHSAWRVAAAAELADIRQREKDQSNK